jgi:hypothetical protein
MAASIAPDWATLPEAELLARVRVLARSGHTANAPLHPYLSNLRPLHDGDGELVARLAIYPHSKVDLGWEFEHPGVVTVGGLRASALTSIMGLARGRASTAARDAAVPTVPADVLATWATEQASLIAEMGIEPAAQASCATVVHCCGGDTGPMSIAQTAGGWLDADGICAWADGLREIVVLQDATLSVEQDRRGSFELAPNVIAVAMGVGAILRHTAHVMPGSLNERLLRAVAVAWNLSLDELVAGMEVSSRDTPVVVIIGQRDGEEAVHSHVRILRRPARDS